MTDLCVCQNRLLFKYGEKPEVSRKAERQADFFPGGTAGLFTAFSDQETEQIIPQDSAHKDGAEAGLSKAVKDQACEKKPCIAQASVLFRTDVVKDYDRRKKKYEERE